MRAVLRPVLIAAGLLLALSACTPQEIALFEAVTAKHKATATDSQLSQLRQCESGSNYSAVSPSGAYRGAYQFSQATWDGVAERNYPWLEDIDPAEADWWWQDAMARALVGESGWSPWPHCGASL